MLIQTPDWVRDAVFYQIFPDRFAASARLPEPPRLEPWDAPPTELGFKGGDLLGIVERLDELVDLGVTALYLTPIFTSASNHRYHTDDYLHVDPLLGGDEALAELLREAHARDVRVVLDGVFNHVGRGFWPFHHVVENGAASPYCDWFHLDEAVLAGERGLRPFPDAADRAAMRALASQGEPTGSISRRVLGYEAWWDLPALPKLNVREPAVRHMLLDVAERWLRLGIDGWRLDVAEEVEGDFWREFRARAKGVSPDAYLVAEIWHPKPEWLTGEHFDAFMNYPLAFAILGFTAGESLDRAVADEQHTYRRDLRPLDAPAFAARLGELLRLYPGAVTSVMLNLLGSHDTPRPLSVCGGDVAAFRMATLIQMTLPGAPCIYYGDEIGLEGRTDPGCRRGFPRDLSDGDLELRSFVRELVSLRRSTPALRDGPVRVLLAEGTNVAFLREGESDAYLVALAAGTSPAQLHVPLPSGSRSAELLTPVPGSVTTRLVSPGEDGGDGPDGAALELRLPARTGAIVRLLR
jgi:cyclomaltodextrinase / maltogenic alpha-amylase / neopullulanase